MAGQKSSWQQDVESYRDKELDKTTTSEAGQTNSVEDDFASLLLPMLAAGEDSLLLPTRPIEDPPRDGVYEAQPRNQHQKQQFARFPDMDELSNNSRQWETGTESNQEYITEEDFLCHYASLRRPDRTSLANIYGETGYYNLSHPVAPTTFYEPHDNQDAQAIQSNLSMGYQGYYPRESRNYAMRGYSAEASTGYDVPEEQQQQHYGLLNQGRVHESSRPRWRRQEPPQSSSGLNGQGPYEKRSMDLTPRPLGSSEEHLEEQTRLAGHQQAVPTSIKAESRMPDQLQYNATIDVDENMDYLQFQKPEIDTRLSVGARPSRAPLDMSAKLSGNFFLEVRDGEDISGGDVNRASSRLTCYRRNYIQVSANLSGLDSLETIQYESTAELSEDGVLNRKRHERRTGRVKKLFATLSGETDVAKRNVKLIYAPPKQTDLTDATEYLPPRLALDVNSPKQSISWRRLQFRTATANNIRQSIQQHFTIRLCLWAKMDRGDEVILLTSVSQPIIVRGRNPKFYSKCKDIPLSETRNADMYKVNDLSNYQKKIEPSETPSETPGRKRTSESTPPRIVKSGLAISNILDDNDESDVSYDKSAGGVAKEPSPKVQSSENMSESVASAEIGEQDNYRFFPISTGYGMPPVEVVYHPHAVHHPRLLSKDQAEVQKATSPIETNRVKRYFVAV